MFAKIGKIVGYTKAPKATMMLLHPIKGTKALVAARGARGLVSTWPGAMLGAMLAVPLGLWALIRGAR